MTPQNVTIRGAGVAACCCAHLLDAAVQEADRPRLPAILVNDATQQLMCEVFGRGDLFAGLPIIERRVVLWGTGKTVELPHRAVVVSEEELRARLVPRVADDGDAGWAIYAARRRAGCIEHGFGSRYATAIPVTLRGDATACWVESVEGGWLFLLPGWLLAVGGEAGELLAASRLVAGQIDLCQGDGARFPAYPRIVDPLCAPGWIACGSAALGFDPLCGDGTGYSVREGILAAAVVRAVRRGGDVNGLLEHYRRRTIAAFRRHLGLCREFYRTGGSGVWWREELEGIERGIEWCGAEPRFRYRLSGYDLLLVE